MAAESHVDRGKIELRLSKRLAYSRGQGEEIGICKGEKLTLVVVGQS